MAIVRPCGLMVVLVLLASGHLPAADAAKNPIEELREALQIFGEVQFKSIAPTGVRKKEWEAEVKAWETKIAAAEKAIVGLDDLCRAVLLDEWPWIQPGADESDEPSKVRARVRDALGKRIVASVRATLAKGDSSRRLAVLTLIADSARVEQEPWRAGLRGAAIFPTFKQDITSLLKKEKDSRVRIGAMHALPQLQAKGVEMATVLKHGLTKTSNVAERRAAAGILQSFLVLEARHKRSAPGFGHPVRPGFKEKERHSLVPVWKERSEPLLHLTGQGARDSDPTVRLLCLAALGIAIGEFRDSCMVDFENSGPRYAMKPVTPRDAPEQELAAFRQTWKELLWALNHELAAAREALKDPELAVCLSAHKTIEIAATARRTLGHRVLIDPAIKEKTDSLDEPVKAVPALVESLRHKELRVRLAALYALETLAADAAVAAGALAAALKDDNQYIRWAAARALRNMAPRGADKEVPALAAALTDDSSDVRNTAAVALARCGPGAKGAVNQLIKVLGNGDEKLRLLAARALGAVGTEAKPAEAVLARALADAKPAIRAAAATALGRLGTLKKETRDALTEKAVNDADSGVRVAAAAALLRAR